MLLKIRSGVQCTFVGLLTDRTNKYFVLTQSHAVVSSSHWANHCENHEGKISIELNILGLRFQQIFSEYFQIWHRIFNQSLTFQSTVLKVVSKYTTKSRNFGTKKEKHFFN